MPKEKKRRMTKFPGIKRPSTAYIFFCNEKRPDLRSAKPELSMTELSKELGQMWRDTDEGDREKYYKMANEDQVRYQKELAQMKDKMPTGAHY